RSAHAADPQRGGDRRGRPGAVSGGSDRQPLGHAADQEGQGGLVRDADQDPSSRRLSQLHAQPPACRRHRVAARLIGGPAQPPPWVEYTQSASTPTMNTAMTISQVRPLVVPMPRRRRNLDQPNATSSARNTSRINPAAIASSWLTGGPRRDGASVTSIDPLRCGVSPWPAG